MTDRSDGKGVSHVTRPPVAGVTPGASRIWLFDNRTLCSNIESGVGCRPSCHRPKRAIAHAARLRRPTVDDWIRVNRAIPRLVDVLPNGPRNHPTVHAFMAGGVPEVMLHLRRMGLLELEAGSFGEGGEQRCVEEIVRRQRQYAKRQRTWFKKEPWWTRLDARAPDLLASVRAQLERA